MMIRMLASTIILSSLLISLAAAISHGHPPVKPRAFIRASVQAPHAVPIQNPPAVPAQNTPTVPVKGSSPVVPVKGSSPVVPVKGPGAVPVKGPGAVPVKGSRPVVPVKGPGAVPVKGSRPVVPVKGPGAVPVKGPGAVPVKGPGAVPVKSPGAVPVKGQGASPVQGQGGVPVKGQGGVPVKGQGGVPVKGRDTVPVQVRIPAAAENDRGEQHKANIVRMQQFLDTHNKARLELGLKALIWDAKLQKYSKEWAVSRAKDCKLIHSHGPYGENMFWSQWSHWTPDKAVGAWMDENKYYNAKTNTCAPGKTCGHYTQIMWRSTARIGCTRIKCDKNAGFITVCTYDPPGNYEGEGPLDLNQIVD